MLLAMTLSATRAWLAKCSNPVQPSVVQAADAVQIQTFGCMQDWKRKFDELEDSFNKIESEKRRLGRELFRSNSSFKEAEDSIKVIDLQGILHAGLLSNPYWACTFVPLPNLSDSTNNGSYKSVLSHSDHDCNNSCKA